MALDTPLRTAIVGCGKVASTHALAWGNPPDSQFAAVCDIDPARAGRLAAEFGVRVYTNLAEMIERRPGYQGEPPGPGPAESILRVSAAK